MSPSRSVSSSTAPIELVSGQRVVLTARWVLVLTGLLLTLLAPRTLNMVRFQVMVLLALAVANFYLCAQVFMRKPALKQVVYASSLADLIVITLIVLSQGGFPSNTYIFYFPALLALSVALPTPALVVFAAGTVGAYGLAGMVSMVNPGADLPVLVIRLLMLSAVAVCGHQYERMERARRAGATRPATAAAVQSAPQAQPAGD